MILATINTDINTATWVPIALPTEQDCEDYAVQARTSVDIIISSEETGATYWTIKADSSISLNEVLGPKAYFFYAKSLVSITTIEIQPLRRHRGK